MLLVVQDTLSDFGRRHADATRSLSTWRHLSDARQQDPSADPVGRVTIVDGRSDRAVTIINDVAGVVAVSGVSTHDEYTRGDGKRR